jgi:putative membrane protein
VTRSSRILTTVLVAVVPALVLGMFVGALAAADHGDARVPAAIVNQDRFVQAKGADGRTTTIAAGRLLVTGLTKPATPASGATIDWRLSNAKQAADLLKNGQVYAVVTIPRGFSKAVSTISGTSPERAGVTITTDDAHGYVVGQLNQSLGTTFTGSVGKVLTTNVVKGLYSGYSTLRTSLGKAASGANDLGAGTDSLAGGLTKLASGQQSVASGATGLATGAQGLASGADRLASGLDGAATGARSTASGAERLASGVSSYTNGVDSLASGLRRLSSSTTGLKALPAGVQQYTSGVTRSKNALAQVLASDPTINPRTRAALQQVEGGLGALSSSGSSLVRGAQGAATVQSAVASSASGASTLAGAGAGLRSGADSLASGLRRLAAGVSSSASGASSLGEGARQLGSGASGLASAASKIGDGITSSAAGATKLADGEKSLGAGLATAADKLPNATTGQVSRIADVVAQPVSATTVRLHETQSIGQVVAALLMPAGLWIGALASVLLLGAVRRHLLTTAIPTGRLVTGAFARGALLAVGQAVLLVALLQATLQPPLTMLPLVLLVSAVAAVAFLALHQLLVAAFGRVGLVLSLVLLAFQLIAAGGLYPVELLSAPFQVVSPYLPMTAAVHALQAVLTGADPAGAVTGAIAVLALYGLAAFVLTTAVVARRRRSVALFAPPLATAPSVRMAA